MKAIVYTEYGLPENLRLAEVEKPTPKDNEVLVKIHAASLNAADWYLLRGTPFFLRLQYGLRKPQNPTLGADISGQVEAVGKDVQRFKPGDAVIGDLSGCGMGGFAEYAAAPENVLTLKSPGVSFEEAAAVPMAGVTALQGLRDNGRLQAGQKVLIYGASGGVGTFAVQIAKAFGADVTAVCSTRNLDIVRSLGADRVIDYTREDFAASGQRYDLIFAANGNRSIFEYRRALTPQGIYVLGGGSMKQIFQAMLMGSLLSAKGGRQLGNLFAKPSSDDLAFLNELLEAGKVRPVIDSCYPLHETPDALRYLGEGHAKGKIIITMAASAPA